MNILSEIGKSIYNPAYYRKILERPISYSFQYFYSFVIALSLLLTVATSIFAVPAARSFLSSVGNGVIADYPDNLVIDIKDGIASSNASAPVFFKMPKGFTGGDGSFENLIVVDAKNDFNLDKFKGYKTFFLLNRGGLSYNGSYNGGGGAVVRQLKSSRNLSITKDGVKSFFAGIRSYEKFLPAIIIFGLFFFYLFALAFKLLYLLPGALLILLVLKINNIKSSYAKSYQIGLHAMTLGIILDYAAFEALPSARVSVFFSLVTIAVVWTNFAKKDQKSLT